MIKHTISQSAYDEKIRKYHVRNDEFLTSQGRDAHLFSTKLQDLRIGEKLRFLGWATHLFAASKVAVETSQQSRSTCFPSTVQNITGS